MRLMLRRAVVLGLVLVGTVAVRAGDPLLTMLDPYFRIQTSLSDDKTDGVKADAAAIANAAKAMGDSGAPIAKAAVALEGAADLAAARTAFSQLSDAVIALSESTKLQPVDGMQAMFCPMANKQWLQKGNKVSNPYYGKAMLTCGEKKKKST
jgi:Protein of unknown function (DUF3347)